jgi:hypothetical protein
MIFDKKWREARKAAGYDREYAEGFKWAMAEVYLKERTPDDVEMQVDIGSMDNCSVFDDGARKAIRVLRRFEKTVESHSKLQIIRNELRTVLDKLSRGKWTTPG